MLDDIYQNRFHYLVLFLGLFLGLVLFIVSQKLGLVDLEKEGVIGLCTFYFLWGVVHHWLLKDLHWRIILEYFLVALLGCLTLLLVINRI